LMDTSSPSRAFFIWVAIPLFISLIFIDIYFIFKVLIKRQKTSVEEYYLNDVNSLI
jgi:hypothetical protein